MGTHKGTAMCVDTGMGMGTDILEGLSTGTADIERLGSGCTGVYAAATQRLCRAYAVNLQWLHSDSTCDNAANTDGRTYTPQAHCCHPCE